MNKITNARIRGLRGYYYVECYLEVRHSGQMWVPIGLYDNRDEAVAHINRITKILKEIEK